ncbi:MAG TPA: DUF4244 domain-containing protein [Mycobacteriales bacterium]|nr:DUF4244 domain-containing protein [Mycobacteriales bacterium]
MRTWWTRFRRLGEAGMTTAEYAVGIVAAVAFAGILLKVLTSPTVQQALTSIVTKALK